MKHDLFKKIDEHLTNFTQQFTQFEKLSKDCSVWAEDRIRQSEINKNVQDPNDEFLYEELSKIRLQK